MPHILQASRSRSSYQELATELRCNATIKAFALIVCGL